MDKQILVSPYSETLSAIKMNELLMYNNMDESQNHHAEKRKPDTKEYIIYDSSNT